MTAPDKLTVEQVDRDAAATLVADDKILNEPTRGYEKAAYSCGDNDDTALVQAFARHRQQAEARAEGLVAALEKIDLMDTDYTRGADHNLELARDIAREALTAYRSARP